MWLSVEKEMWSFLHSFLVGSLERLGMWWIYPKLTNNSDLYIDILEEIQYNVKLVDSVSKEFYIFNSKINDFDEIKDYYKELDKKHNYNENISIYMTYNIEEGRTINDKIKVSNAW